MKESESRQHAPRDLETGSNGGNLSGNLKSKPQTLKQDHPQSYGMQFQHYKMVYQCILYVIFQDIETWLWKRVHLVCRFTYDKWWLSLAVYATRGYIWSCFSNIQLRGKWQLGAIPKSLRQSLVNHPADLNLLVALLKKSPIHTSIELGELTPQTRSTFQSLSC